MATYNERPGTALHRRGKGCLVGGCGGLGMVGGLLALWSLWYLPTPTTAVMVRVLTPVGAKP